MSKVVFELATGVDGTVELRDCMFVDWWKHVFKLNKPIGIRQKRMTCYYRDIKHPFKGPAELWMDGLEAQHNLQEFEQKNIDLINKGIDEIIELGLPWNRERPYMGMNWKITNDIHRGFTTLDLTNTESKIELDHETKCKMMWKQYNFHDKNGREFLTQFSKMDDTEIPKERQKNDWIESFEASVHQINSGVHNIEDGARVSERRLRLGFEVFPEAEYPVIFPNLDWQSKDPEDNRTDRVKVDYNLSEMANWACDNNPHWNVYDLKNILGKDYLNAYCDYDDPGEWDVCNHFKTTKGGFEILPHMHKLVNDVFVPWIQSFGYPADPMFISPIQIGHIDENWLLEFCTARSIEENKKQDEHNHIINVELID